MKKKPEWYSEEAGFFGQYYLETYEPLLAQQNTKEQVDFIEEVLHLKKGMNILDLACGHGRHSIELARRGYNVTGQDLNSHFLKQAEKAAKESGVEVHWVKSDMRDIPFEGEFDVVLNLFTAFGYLESDVEDQKVLHQVAKALKPNGIFLMDTMNKEWLIRVFQKRDWEQFPDDSVEVQDREFNFQTGRLYVQHLRIYKDGRREEREIYLRLYTLPELIKMCEAAGLSFQEAYGNFQGESYGFNAKRCIVIARKRN